MSEISFDPKWRPTDKEIIEILRWLFKPKNHDYAFGLFRQDWIEKEKYPNNNKSLSNKEWVDAVHKGNIKPTLEATP